MLSMNVFKQDAFSAISLSAAVDKMDYVPDFLSAMPGLFEDDPVRTVEIWIEERSTGAVILPFSPRGTAPHQTGGDQRKARAFATLRFGDASRITASELLSIRSFGSEVNVKSLQEEVGRRQMKIKRNMQLTKEYHKFNLVTQGKVLDADGTTLKVDWASELSQTIPDPVNLAVTTYDSNGGLRKTINGIRRTIQKNLKGVGSAKKIVALCGDNFYDAMSGNKEVRETYLNTVKAADLQSNAQEWESFSYGNVTWINYRGTDDGSFGVNTDHCHFIPMGAGIFRWALSPGESFDHIGTAGQEVYSRIVTDKDRDEWADVEVTTYPLPVCTMPQALMQGVKV